MAWYRSDPAKRRQGVFEVHRLGVEMVALIGGKPLVIEAQLVQEIHGKSASDGLYRPI
jgi:hypothetical protein